MHAIWRSCITTGARSLAADRGFTLINVVGLAIGIAAALLILLYVRHETRYESFLPEADRAYQFQTLYHQQNTGQPNHIRMASYVTKKALLDEFEDIESAVFVTKQSATILRDGLALAAEDFLYVDGPITDILRLPYLEGDPQTALDATNSILLSESEALRHFGTARALGKTLTIADRGRQTTYRVTGVFSDIPTYSHFAAGYIARFDPHAYFINDAQFLTSWGWQSGWVYLRLRPGADAAAINRALPEWETRHVPPSDIEGTPIDQIAIVDYALVNIRDIHLGDAQSGVLRRGNSRDTVFAFAVIAALILAMACINFINLSTARSVRRAREVAIRKVLGARRWQLMLQFLFETVIVAGIAMLIGLSIAELAAPSIGALLDVDLSFHYFGKQGVLLPVLALTIVIGLVGGVYPAFRLSRYQPASILKANRSTNTIEGSGRVRTLLVLIQFAASIGLMICTVIVAQQTMHAHTADPGYTRSGILQITGMSQPEVMARTDALKRAIAQVDGVVAVARSQIGVSTGDNRNRAARLPGKAEPVLIGSYHVDEDFFRMMGMRIIAGRDFDPAVPLDDATTPIPEDVEAEKRFMARGVNVIANEAAVRRLGLGTPQEAIGKSFSLAWNLETGSVRATIVGVVNDTRFRSVRTPIDAILFAYHRYGHSTMLVRHAGDPARVRQGIEEAWRHVLPQTPIDISDPDAILREIYAPEQARSRIFATASLLAILIGCLGLFSLATFTAERRTREIGIRKVLGATTPMIIRLLIWQFSKPVLIANLIAWPIAYWAMERWLAGFDSRIALTPLPFIAAAAVALIIATTTIAIHAFRVARTNPIHALRYE